ncbi:MAG: hypothetical protein NC184_03110 [Roseburia sp.]|nr:hypothetical protein [Roseburia sp.]
MICPQCGYDVGNNHKCKRCGYEIKTLATVDESVKNKSDDAETKVIDPNDVYISREYVSDDFGFGFSDPFSSLFDDLFGDPISSLLGGLFGFDLGGPRSEPDAPEPKSKKKGSGKVVEVNKVEILDENGNPVDEQSGKKSKNPFKRNGNRDKK